MDNKERKEKEEKLFKELNILNGAAEILQSRRGESFNLNKECWTLSEEIGKILQELVDLNQNNNQTEMNN